MTGCFSNMEDIEIENIDLEMFNHLRNLESVYFKKYKYCSFVPNVPKCRPLSDGLTMFKFLQNKNMSVVSGVSSTYQLLDKPILRYATWTICFFTCFGNSLVLWGRFSFKDDNKILNLIIKNLAGKNDLCSFCLWTIAFQWAISSWASTCSS